MWYIVGMTLGLFVELATGDDPLPGEKACHKDNKGSPLVVLYVCMYVYIYIYIYCTPALGLITPVVLFVVFVNP